MHGDGSTHAWRQSRFQNHCLGALGRPGPQPTASFLLMPMGCPLPLEPRTYCDLVLPLWWGPVCPRLTPGLPGDETACVPHVTNSFLFLLCVPAPYTPNHFHHRWGSGAPEVGSMQRSTGTRVQTPAELGTCHALWCLPREANVNGWNYQGQGCGA